MSAIIRNNGFYYPDLLDSLFGKNVLNGSGLNGNVPAVNIVEKKEGFRLEIAAPGLKKEDFNLNLERNQLTVSSKKVQSSESTEEKYSVKEFSFKSFQRTFTLPESIDAGKVSASYENGVLQIQLPKKEEALGLAPREIAVN